MVVALLYEHAEQKAVQDSQSKSGFSFGAEQRIPTNKGFAHCLKSSSISNSYYKIFFTPNQEETSRLGVIASKRLMQRAIDRNRNKRQIRELFRKHSIKSRSFDIVVMIRKVDMPNLHVQLRDLVHLFDKLEARCV